MTGTVWDFLHEIAREVIELRGDLAAAEARQERMFRKGKVTDVDAKTRKYRQEIGVDDEGNPVKSPWVRYAQFAGSRREHTPPFVGQQFLLISPDGDHEQGHGIALTHSNDTPSPSDKDDEHVDQWGDLKTTVSDGKHVREVGPMKLTHTKDSLLMELDGTSFTFSKAGLDVKNGKLTHDGKDIGSSHKHGGVMKGGGDTDVPLA